MNLRELARGQTCIRCGADDGTVVLAHYFGPRRHAYGGGMGHKGHDAVAAELCARCHSWFDTGCRNKATKYEASEEFLHCVALTWIRRIEQGLVTIGNRAVA